MCLARSPETPSIRDSDDSDSTSSNSEEDSDSSSVSGSGVDSKSVKHFAYFACFTRLSDVPCFNRVPRSFPSAFDKKVCTVNITEQRAENTEGASVIY